MASCKELTRLAPACPLGQPQITRQWAQQGGAGIRLSKAPQCPSWAASCVPEARASPAPGPLEANGLHLMPLKALPCWPFLGVVRGTGQDSRASPALPLPCELRDKAGVAGPLAATSSPHRPRTLRSVWGADHGPKGGAGVSAGSGGPMPDHIRVPL